MNLMMLAAGEGTRLRPYTLQKPKPAIPFLNVPLAGWSLAFLGDIKINRICVNTFHLPQHVHSLFKNLSLPSSDLNFSDEKGSILGSGGGLEKARVYLENQGPLILMNSDEVILPEDENVINLAIEQHKLKNPIATLLVTENSEVGSKFGGIWIDEKGKVIGFGKQIPANAVKGWHFVGVQILSDRIFNYLPQNTESNILYDGLMKAIDNGETVEVFPFNCVWFETGNPTDFLSATKECMQIICESPNSVEAKYITKVLNRHLGDNWSLEKNEEMQLLAHNHSEVSLDTKIKGFAVIGDGAKIESEATLHNAIIGSNVLIDSQSSVENTIRL